MCFNFFTLQSKLEIYRFFFCCMFIISEDMESHKISLRINICGSIFINVLKYNHIIH